MQPAATQATKTRRALPGRSTSHTQQQTKRFAQPDDTPTYQHTTPAKRSAGTHPRLMPHKASMVVVMVAVAVSAQPVGVAAMVMSIRHHGQQGDGCNTQQQHGKLGPACKNLGDVRPAAARQQNKDYVMEGASKGHR